MIFRIADSFTDSLARLAADEQKAAKITVIDLQMNPAQPGLQFHKLDKAKDKRFWSLRVSSDVRLIVHRDQDSLLVCYVDHHDAAYAWAERRRLEVHPKTGALQMVEVRERVEEVVIQKPVRAALLSHVTEEELLGYGVPPEWMADVQAVRDEDALLALVEHLPREAAEALLDLATGSRPQRVSTPAVADPFAHPDAQRRFRVIGDRDELERALEFPWEKWAIFLHPSQRALVERAYAGPARVAGTAGTGKTIVALHRAVHVANKDEHARVLLTTFSEPLANALLAKLRVLLHSQPVLGERIEVASLDAVGRRLYERTVGPFRPAPERLPFPEGTGFSRAFLQAEWDEIFDAWGIETWEQYRTVPRLGRKTRLSEKQRQRVWEILAGVKAELQRLGVVTEAQMFHALGRSPFAHVIVDECQDISIPQLLFLARSGAQLFFAGDIGQRIFRQAFSWKAAGVDLRGRSGTLKINYRTSHQIRKQADRLLGPELADGDGVTEDRRGVVSLFTGPVPEIRTYATKEEEIDGVAEWLRSRTHDAAIFVRSEAEIPRAKAVAERAGAAYRVLDHRVDLAANTVSLATMHLAKGLEFRAVVVMACDDEVLPLQSRIESATDESDLDEVYGTERHLLYVACTRARDELLVTGVRPGSEFLADLRPA